MAIQEHDNNIFTKEKDVIDRYLMKVIHRYFELETEFNRIEIESIIEESLARLKQTVFTKGKGKYVFNFNRRTGYINLQIRDFNGETKFDKQTAFNKDWADENDIAPGTSGVIVCGNDIRLSNKREPLYHEHEIENINELKEKLTLILEQAHSHYHVNNKILDIIQYTGTSITIDLAIIDFLIEFLNTKINNLRNYNIQINTAKQDFLNELQDIHQECSDRYVFFKQHISHILNWIENAKSYDDITANNTKIYWKQLFKSYLTKYETRKLLKYYNKVYRCISQNIAPCQDLALEYYYDESYNRTTISLRNTIEIACPPMLNISNIKPKVWLIYNDLLSNEVKTLIPFAMLNHNNEFISIQLRFDNAHLYIDTNTISYIKDKINSMYIYNRKDILFLDNRLYNYNEATSYCYEKQYDLCVIDSQDKLDFVLSKCESESEYLIDGTYRQQSISYGDYGWYDSNDNLITFENWDDGFDPINANPNDVLYLTSNGKIGFCSQENCIGKKLAMEYRTKNNLNYYFDNPQFSYQIFGLKEVNLN